MERIKLVLYGKCRVCGRFLVSPVIADYDERELLHRCDCGSNDIVWEQALHGHRFSGRPSRRFPLVPTLVVVATLLAASALLALSCIIHQSYTAEEVDTAMKEMSGMTVSEILTRFEREGVGDATLGRMVGASPYVVKRLREGASPTFPAEAAVRGIYCQYVLNGRSWLLTRLQIGKGRGAADLGYAFLDPRFERFD